MSSVALRDAVAAYIESVIQAEVAVPLPAPIAVRKCAVPVVELEKDPGYVVEVYPLGLNAERAFRDDWTITRTIRVLIRTMNGSRSASAIAATEEEFIVVTEWLQQKLMDMRLTDAHVVSAVQDREVFSREMYAENHALIALLDLVMVTYA